MTADALPYDASGDDGPLRRQSRTIWIIAALGAFGIHAAAGGLCFHYLQPDASDDLGAPALAIDVDLAAPRREQTDLPIGPDTTASAPAPEVVEQKAVIQPIDLPKDMPTETDDPDRFVSPDEAKKFDDPDPKITSVQATPSNASVATEETAVPTVEAAPEWSQSTAPALGTGASTVRERVTWEKELAVHFNKFKRYPAERAMQSARVVVSFVLDRMGHVVSSHIDKGSGDAAFDAAALAMLQRADPVPQPPPLVADGGLSFSLPVIFQVTHKNDPPPK